MRRLVVITGILCLLLVTAVSAGNNRTGGLELGGNDAEQQPPPNQTEDPSQVVPTQSAPILVPTQEAPPVVPTQQSAFPESLPADPLTGVYCASSAALLRINGIEPPQPTGGCICVRAYGVHTLETGPDLYAGVDETRIDSFSTSPGQCLSGVTTYAWSAGSYDAGTFVPNPNGTPAVEVVATEAPIVDNSLSLLVDARADLESLAINTIGTTRPEGWSGSLEVTDPALPLLIRFDLELLTDALLGAGVRPDNWFGSVASTPYALIRDVRHDLELLVDTHLGVGSRPSGWAGTKGNTILTCNRATQTLVSLLQRGGVFQLTIDPNDPAYCMRAELAATSFAETNLLSNPADRPIFSAVAQAGSRGGALTIDTEFAVAFLDKGAALSVGVVPQGEQLTARGRSRSQFSRMTLVEGNGFLVFVDYRDTTLTEEDFEVLPDAGEYTKSPFCSASWCGD